MRKLGTLISAGVFSAAWADKASAWSFWDCVPTVTEVVDTTGVPEIDGGAGLAAIALLSCVAAIVRRTVQQ